MASERIIHVDDLSNPLGGSVPRVEHSDTPALQEWGTHQLALYKDCYLTVVQEFTILPGVIQEVKFRLAPGKSVPPNEFLAQLGVDDNS